MKINVLKNGVLNERQKNQELEQVIKSKDKKVADLEDIITEKVSTSK